MDGGAIFVELCFDISVQFPTAGHLPVVGNIF